MTTNSTRTDHATRLASSWCRMWNADAGLAHELAAPGFRMWLGASADGDAVRGPAELAAFVAAFQQRVGTTFTPRVVVADQGRFAYTWDAVRPDGVAFTGVDINVLDRSGRIEHNLSIIGERVETEPDTGADPVDPAHAGHRCAEWTTVWNGELDLAGRILTPGFRVWFDARAAADDALRGPDAFAAYVARHRAARPGLRFSYEPGDVVVDAAGGRAAFPWTATVGDARRGGIDVLAFAGGRIDRVWSWTGARPFTTPPRIA